ncbi:MAG TPA: arylsulfatase [Bradyrhizobium sp.]|uniref:arylsulfatase n=1 Tax=Bradyrhizobium sp. TaxID=376 RepID=UPI002C47DD60|nr:arylsulfatase [Bradyrhizobium sp.]HXB76489.1 arylsulfatase [Bradyrhizobium sp.]
MSIKSTRFISGFATVLATVVIATLSQAASAQNPTTTAPAASLSLPRPDFHFKGEVGRTYQDSDPATFPQIVRPPRGAPNIVLILLDDVGFGQFSVFGGGVPSPNMEKLAAQGLRYNRFHTTALCSPTRAALITGRNHHMSGNGSITEAATGYDGYTGIIPKSTGTIAEILRQNGYATAWIGKNHNTPVWETSEIGPFDRWANGLGFDYFYGFNAGDTSQYEPILYENRNRVQRSSDPNYHLSTDIADHAIAWMQKEKVIDPDRPFFLYVAPAATHSPHHAPKEWIDRFKGQFDMGWDRYREVTYERQKQLGVIPATAKLTPRPAGLPAWDSLNADQKRLYARMMEIFAGYGAHVENEMGRVLEAVAKLPDADNTLIFYIIGDNGSSAEGGPEGSTNENAFFNSIVETWQDNLRVIDELGGPKHFNHFPSAWAWAMNTPFQWTKQVASHFGGTRNPMIVSWPAKITDKGGLRSQFHHVIDIMPTLLEVAGVQAPDVLNGIPQKPLDGASLAYTFSDAKAADRRKSQIFEMGVNRGMYQNGWMASSLSFVPWQPVRTGFDIDKAKWELYNIDEDFSQGDDLAMKNPEKLRALQDLWWAEAARNNVLPLDWRGPERMSVELTGKPSLAAGRKIFVYETPLAALPEASSPDLKNKSFTITAEADIPAGGADGMIFTQGGFTGGWGFYIQQGKLVGLHSHVALERYRVVSTEPVPTGKVTLAMDFKYDGGGVAKGGTITLFANGKKLGEGRVEKTTPFKYSLYEGQDIGEDTGSPVDFSYAPPFKFAGKLGRVTVELK